MCVSLGGKEGREMEGGREGGEGEVEWEKEMEGWAEGERREKE